MADSPTPPSARARVSSPLPSRSDLPAARKALALIDDPLFAEHRAPAEHPARPDGAIGFCLLNNVTVAAAHARARGVARIAIVDFDVHHGNETQEIFYADPSVLYISLHQFPFYPGNGAADETGRGDGRGFTV